MATDVILPVLGMAQDSGKIVEWLKTEGDAVTQGEPLVTVETDKALVDLEAPASGTLARVSARAGDEVPVAQVIAVILAPGESPDAGISGPSRPHAVAESALVAPTGQPAMHTATAASAPPASAPTHNGRRAASPKARRIAAERGLDIAAISGSGPGGVVLAADVLAAPSGGVTTIAQQAPTAATSREPGAADSSAVSGVWRLMAERTTQSWTTVPHFFLTREVNATRLIAWRERALRHESDQVTYTDLLVRVVAEALRRHPRVNASWDQGAIKSNAAINIGLAVATEQGLVVPVIHQADDLALRGIARQRADLVARAQAGALRLPDLQDGTFTISNLGMYGIDAFNAIINAPQAAILAVGRIVDRVVPVAGQPAVQPMMTLTLSCDHRVVDGARGAEFLASVAALIEDPPDHGR